MIADAIAPCLGEGWVGHLVHADAARGWLINREGIPGQAPPPIGARQRVAGALDLRERRQQFGCNRGGGILAKERRILAPGLKRRFVERTAYGKEHLGRLAHDMIDEVCREKDGEDGRSNGGDPDRQWRGSQLAPHPAHALAQQRRRRERESRRICVLRDGTRARRGEDIGSNSLITHLNGSARHPQRYSGWSTDPDIALRRRKSRS